MEKNANSFPLCRNRNGTATIESKTNFFAATRSGTVKAHSHPLHIGKRVIVVETEIRGDDGQLAAKTIQSQAVL